MEGQKFTSGDFVYAVTSRAKNDGTAGTVKVAGVAAKNKKTLVIPQVVQQGSLRYRVTAVASAAFKNQKKLQKITVSNKVKVSKNAFKGCKKKLRISGKKSY